MKLNATSLFFQHTQKRVSSATSHHSSSSLPTNDNHNLADDAPPVDSPEHGVHRIFFNTPLPDEMIDPELEAPIINYPRNKIRTAKYTLLSTKTSISNSKTLQTFTFCSSSSWVHSPSLVSKILVLLPSQSFSL